MSENYGFGYYSGDPDEIENQQSPQTPQEPQQAAPEPKWFRDYMKKSQAELQELRDKLASKEVAEQFQAKGYDPAAAGLYKGDPAKVDEWLTSHGPLLAKRPGAEQQESEQVQQQGPPATTVSTDNQEQLQRMQAAGTGAAPSQGTEAEISAALNATRTIEEFEQVARANGWPYNADGLFG